MQVDRGRFFMGRLLYKADLLESLTKVCQKENIRLASVSVIGAVSSACVGYYDQSNKAYQNCVNVNEKLEIAACLGNVSLKDGNIFVHAHVVFSDGQGKCYGGHLMPGTTVFAAEYVIQELTALALVRENDEQTGLSLWKRGF